MFCCTVTEFVRPDSTTPALTPRERELAALVAQGLDNLQIAARLGVADKTPSTWLARCGRFDAARSDYDLIARFAPDESQSMGRRFVAFSEALEALLGRSVDLMTDHPIENPYLRAAVSATRRIVYAQPTAEASA